MLSDRGGPTYRVAISRAYALAGSLGDVVTLAPWAERVPPDHVPDGPGAELMTLAIARSMLERGFVGDAGLLLEERAAAAGFQAATALTAGTIAQQLDRPDEALQHWQVAQRHPAVGAEAAAVTEAAFRAASVELELDRLDRAYDWLMAVPSGAGRAGLARAAAAEMAMVAGDASGVAEALRQARRLERQGTMAPGAEVTWASHLAARCKPERAERAVRRALKGLEPLDLALDGLTAGRGMEAEDAGRVDRVVRTQLDRFAADDWGAQQIHAHHRALSREVVLIAAAPESEDWGDFFRGHLAPLYGRAAGDLQEWLQAHARRSFAEASERVDGEIDRALRLRDDLRYGAVGVTCPRSP